MGTNGIEKKMDHNPFYTHVGTKLGRFKMCLVNLTTYHLSINQNLRLGLAIAQSCNFEKNIKEYQQGLVMSN
jgi:hypothetical protein